MKLPSTSHIPSISHLLCNFVTQSPAVLCHARLRRELLSHRVQPFHQAWESCDMVQKCPKHVPNLSQVCVFALFYIGLSMFIIVLSQ